MTEARNGSGQSNPDPLRTTERIEQHEDRREQLAADRTVFAAERTYAAWVRTGLAALASGVGAEKLLSGIVPNWMVLMTASILVLFSTFCFGAAVWRDINAGAPPPRPDARHIPAVILVGVNLFLGLVALAALVGILYGHRPMS